MADKDDSRKRRQDRYDGVEQGPIRPPSEAFSLLIRLTRNCPWNQCTFCRVYKGKRFSLRSFGNIIRDIDLIHTYVRRIQEVAQPGRPADQSLINTMYKQFEVKDRVAFNAAMNFYAAGMSSVFLQDANSLIMPAETLIAVLTHLRECFPEIRRITSYARSQSILMIRPEDLVRIRKAGLNRVHIGMESGSDEVLKRVRKGISKKDHIEAGLMVKAAGMELSEYIIPGLGGISLSINHALETAAALSVINPDFIRLRTLAVVPGTVLAEQEASGTFEKPSDAMIAQEIRLFLESLSPIDTYVKSDHILNLFETLEGRLPGDKAKMVGLIDRFFDLSREDQVIYQVGRRMGFFKEPDDMKDSPYLEQVRQACRGFGVTPENVDHVINELMKRFV